MAIFPAHQATVLYGAESPYGTPPVDVDQDFGIIRNTSPRINNSMETYHGIGGGRNAQQIKAAGLLDAGINVDVLLQTGALFEYILGAVSGSGTGIDPFIYAEADTVPSLTIEDGFNLSTDQVLRYLGSVCKRAVIKCKLGEPVQVTLEFDSQKPTKSATLQTVTVPATAVYEFVHGTLEMPTASTISQVQDVEIVIEQGGGRYGGIGSRFGTVYVGARKYTITVKKMLTDGTHIEDAMGGAAACSAGTPASTATLKLNITDGSRYIYIVLSPVWSDNWEAPQELERPIEESISLKAKACTITEVV